MDISSSDECPKLRVSCKLVWLNSPKGSLGIGFIHELVTWVAFDLFESTQFKQKGINLCKKWIPTDGCGPVPGSLSDNDGGFSPQACLYMPLLVTSL